MIETLLRFWPCGPVLEFAVRPPLRKALVDLLFQRALCIFPSRIANHVHPDRFGPRSILSEATQKAPPCGNR